jgi:hypothetical protein
VKKTKIILLSLTAITGLLSCNNSFYKRHYKEGVYKPKHPAVEISSHIRDEKIRTQEDYHTVEMASGDTRSVFFLAVKDTNVNKKKVEYPPKTDDYSKPTPSNNNQQAPTRSGPSDPRTFSANHETAMLSVIFAGVGCFGALFPLSIVALIFANRALREINSNPELEPNRGLAKTGKGLAIASIALWGLVILIYAVLIMFFLFL